VRRAGGCGGGDWWIRGVRVLGLGSGGVGGAFGRGGGGGAGRWLIPRGGWVAGEWFRSLVVVVARRWSCCGLVCMVVRVVG